MQHSRLLTCSVYALLSLVTFSSMHAQQSANAPTASTQRFAIVLHGGAGGDPNSWSEEYKQLRRESLGKALEVGVAAMAQGSSSLEAVEAVIRLMEDDPMFNAGRGCVLNDRGEHELDASIMDGKTRACGAVASIKVAQNPITVARHVMTDTPHVLLIGTGADRFAEGLGVELAGPDYFKTEEQLDAWRQWKARQEAKKKGAAITPERYLGTVGCVAVDSHGNIAAGTSTGGLMGKRWGRVGDSPIVGAGTYADNATCGVSCTGTGEEFIRHNVAADMAARLRYTSQSLSDAAKTIIDDILPDDCGGLIAIDKNYNVVTHFNTAAMARAWADSSGQREIRIALETK